MPTPWLSWPMRLASTKFSATSRASSAPLPPAATTASATPLSAAGDIRFMHASLFRKP